MPVELKVPEMGESIQEVQIGNWLKSAGDNVERDMPVVEIESDKATVEVFAPVSGAITKVLKSTGEKAVAGEVIGLMEESVVSVEKKPKKKSRDDGFAGRDAGGPSGAAVAAAPASSELGAPASLPANVEEPAGMPALPVPPRVVMPAAQRELAVKGLKPEEVEATGPGGRLLKEDVLRHVETEEPVPVTRPAAELGAPASLPANTATPRVSAPAIFAAGLGERLDEAVPMTPMRRRIAERLVQAQQNAALLTTFNEIDMSAIITLREEHQEAFQRRHGVKLGFMSFFIKASIDALKLFPPINAEIRGEDIVYHNYYDIGVSIGGGKGLVVPILRNTEHLGFAEIELAIADFAARAKDNKLKIDELQGGTFTISNGGVYGSLLSTPIVNPPQSAILGMHAIQDRPVARAGQVIIRPMMYVALTYDHRIVDGREAVTFLKRIKECIEAPERMLLEV